MTHGREKSDLSIVATKLANKAGQPVAESVERRERAEGNTGEQHMRRTQGRESVSQGLDRVRKAAQQKKADAVQSASHPETKHIKDHYAPNTCPNETAFDPPRQLDLGLGSGLKVRDVVRQAKEN
jgi:hypothetical protein